MGGSLGCMIAATSADAAPLAAQAAVDDSLVTLEWKIARCIAPHR